MIAEYVKIWYTCTKCTGGLLSATIINVSGASDVINCAYVTYANEAKENLVSVSHETLETKGAVSKETAAEMCVGCAKAAKADMGLSTTGIAGQKKSLLGLCIWAVHCMSRLQ